MKKLILAAMAMGLGASLYAQGTVVFANNSSTLIRTNGALLGGSQGSAATTSSGGTVRLALYWGVLGSTEAQLVQIGSTTGIGPVAGRINAGNYTTGVATAPGESAVFQVRGWTGNFNTYEEARDAALGGDYNIYFNATTPFVAATGGAGTPPGAPATLAGAMPGFILIPVPEPSTYAILGVGLLGLIWKPLRKRVEG